jgi:hypothetical protein
MSRTEDNQTSESPSSTESFTGRSVFMVETSAAGISVQTALLTKDNQLLRAPAVFPDVEYAFAQIDELKRLVSRHFSEAALIGAQVVAAQQANQLKASSTDPAAASLASAAEAQEPPQARSAKAKKPSSR